MLILFLPQLRFLLLCLEYQIESNHKFVGMRISVSAFPCKSTFQYDICFLSATSKAATNLSVKDYGLSGKSLQLLTTSPIQLSGYLISWRFYHVSSDSTCNSYAAVWRKERYNDTVTSYRIVDGSETLLTSESQSGIYYAVIEDRIVRVNEGDIVSIHVNISQTGCKHNRVSFRNGQQRDPVAFYYNVGYPAPTTLNHPVNSDERGVAIQAYVVGKWRKLIIIIFSITD